MRWSSMRYSSMRWTHLIASVRRIADYLQRPFLTVLTARLTSALLLTLPLVAYYWLLTTGCLLLVAYYWLLTAAGRIHRDEPDRQRGPPERAARPQPQHD